MPDSGVSPPVFASSKALQTTEKCPGDDRAGIMARTWVSNVMRPTASRWWIIK